MISDLPVASKERISSAVWVLSDALDDDDRDVRSDDVIGADRTAA